MSDSRLEISFKAEELYFRAAQQALEQAASLRTDVLAEGQDYSLEGLLWLAEAYDLGDEVDPDIDVRDFDTLADSLRAALDRFTLAVASVDVFTVMTMEAHINSIADQRFGNSTQILFDRLSLDGKWLFLPQLVGVGEVFDTGGEPFQSFKQLIRRRNGIVHRKGEGRTVILRATASPDEYMAPKLLTAECGLRAAGSMVNALAKALKVAAPAWVEGELPEHYVTGARL
jgi:hypothetical protein